MKPQWSLGVMLCIFGCVSDVEPQETIRTYAIDTSVPRPEEDTFLRISQEVDSFGGFYCSGGDLKVVVTSRGEVTDARVRQLVESEDVSRLCYNRDVGVRTPQILLVDGAYNFMTLRSWRDAISDAFFEISGAIAIGIDYEANRIGMYLTPSASVSEALSLSQQYGIPDTVIEVKHQEVPRPTLACPAPPYNGYDVEGCFRPIPGGVRFQPGPNGGGGTSLGLCTVTAAGSRYMPQYGIWQPGFVTNSHCLPAMSVNSNDWASQPNWPAAPHQNARVFGVETVDPSGWVCGSWTCRHSDSAWITDTAGAYDTGTIAQTLGWNSNRIISTSHPRFYTWGSVAAVQGMQVEKVGGSTGWSTGLVTKTCWDTISSLGFKIKCSGWATIPSDGGDSGSPLFYWWWFHGVDTVEIVGTVWGKEGSTAYYSPWSQVGLDLGSTYVIWPGF